MSEVHFREIMKSLSLIFRHKKFDALISDFNKIVVLIFRHWWLAKSFTSTKPWVSSRLSSGLAIPTSLHPMKSDLVGNCFKTEFFKSLCFKNQKVTFNEYINTNEWCIIVPLVWTFTFSSPLAFATYIIFLGDHIARIVDFSLHGSWYYLFLCMSYKHSLGLLGKL